MGKYHYKNTEKYIEHLNRHGEVSFPSVKMLSVVLNRYHRLYPDVDLKIIKNKIKIVNG